MILYHHTCQLNLLERTTPCLSEKSIRRRSIGERWCWSRWRACNGMWGAPLQISVDGGAPGWEVVRDAIRLTLMVTPRGGGLSETTASTNFTCRRISVRSRKMDAWQPTSCVITQAIFLSLFAYNCSICSNELTPELTPPLRVHIQIHKYTQIEIVKLNKLRMRRGRVPTELLSTGKRLKWIETVDCSSWTLSCPTTTTSSWNGFKSKEMDFVQPQPAGWCIPVIPQPYQSEHAVPQYPKDSWLYNS